MCGIAGIVPSRDLDPAQLERWVRRMCQSMVHRGPDDEGVFIAPDIGIGVRRLAIIDIQNGGQPMYSSDGRHTIVFNGEIYNYVALRDELQRRGCHFATNCDTEVVLRLFEVGGIDAFQHLEGMFGVAVWDQSEKRLTIARDWLGQKSVYWTRCQFG
jgi:asparagine synthase (glutamine-hydrolysing)